MFVFATKRFVNQIIACNSMYLRRSSHFLKYKERELLLLLRLFFLIGYSFIFLVSDKNYSNFEENGNIMAMTRGALPLIKLIIN